MEFEPMPTITTDIQGVHKVLIHFLIFFIKSILRISQPGWFYFNQCCLKFWFKIKFCVSRMTFMGFMIVLKKTLNKWFLLKRPHNVYPGSLKQNRTFRLVTEWAVTSGCRCPGRSFQDFTAPTLTITSTKKNLIKIYWVINSNQRGKKQSKVSRKSKIKQKYREVFSCKKIRPTAR